MTHLINIRDKLKRRAEILTREIKEDTPTKSLAEINEGSKMVPTKTNKLELSEYLDLQKNQAYKFAFGIHISDIRGVG